MYLTFADYQEMGGTISEETTFNDLAFEASSTIDWYTFGRLRNDAYESLAEEVKRCMYRLIQLILESQQAAAQVSDSEDGGTSESASTIASQSNDGVSVSYNVLSAKDALENAKSEVAETVKKYMSYVTNSLGRKVLYRGIYPGE